MWLKRLFKSMMQFFLSVVLLPLDALVLYNMDDAESVCVVCERERMLSGCVAGCLKRIFLVWVCGC